MLSGTALVALMSMPEVPIVSVFADEALVMTIPFSPSAWPSTGPATRMPRMLKLPPRGAGLIVLALVLRWSVLLKMATSLAPGATLGDQLVPLVKAVLLFALVTSAEPLCGSKMPAPTIRAKVSLTVVANENCMVRHYYLLQ